ncbi:MAG: hypothetical protein ACI37T_01310 [Candidatus Gastranaerophilaceae bacterium]
MLFEYETKITDILKEIGFYFLIIVVLILGGSISVGIFYGGNPLNLVSDLIDNNLFPIFFIIFILEVIVLLVKKMKIISFYDEEIIIANKILKNLEQKTINYQDIDWFLIHPVLNLIDVKSKNRKTCFQLYVDEKSKKKIADILRIRVSSLEESEKLQNKLNESEKIEKVLPLLLLMFIFLIFIIPISSFFITKKADKRLDEYIKSGYKAEKTLDEAYGLYFAGAHNKSYYNYKQILKIDVYRHDKYLADNFAYVNKLFPNKVKETKAILKSKRLTK